jgi:hypothetical protein
VTLHSEHAAAGRPLAYLREGSSPGPIHHATLRYPQDVQNEGAPGRGVGAFRGIGALEVVLALPRKD